MKKQIVMLVLVAALLGFIVVLNPSPREAQGPVESEVEESPQEEASAPAPTLNPLLHFAMQGNDDRVYGTFLKYLQRTTRVALDGCVQVQGIRTDDKGDKTVVASGVGVVLEPELLVAGEGKALSEAGQVLIQQAGIGRLLVAKVLAVDEVTGLALLAPGQPMGPPVGLADVSKSEPGLPVLVLQRSEAVKQFVVNWGFASGRMLQERGGKEFQALCEVVGFSGSGSREAESVVFNTEGELFALKGEKGEVGVTATEIAWVVKTYKTRGRVDRAVVAAAFEEGSVVVKGEGQLGVMREAPVVVSVEKKEGEMQGLQVGDHVLSINDTSVRDARVLKRRIERLEPSKAMRFRVLRNGEEMVVEEMPRSYPPNDFPPSKEIKTQQKDALSQKEITKRAVAPPNPPNPPNDFPPPLFYEKAIAS